jgi:phospholipid-translocating ATPase
MLDGIYQSLICFFMAYLIFHPATPATHNGLGVDDRPRMGVYVATAAVVVVNVYVLLNTYRWDWLMLLIVAISVLLIWFWTGVYSSFTGSYQFYKAASEVYDQLSFWALTLLVVIICLLPRFTIKSLQKIYRPLDVDIIREQVRQGKFDHLNNYEAYVPPGTTVHKAGSSSELSKPIGKVHPTINLPDDELPIYPPSETTTGYTHNRSQNSDGTDYSGPRDLPVRPSMDRARPSFDRIRQSMDKIRPSFEASNDFTSAALLTRMESSHSMNSASQTPLSPHSRRRFDITSDLQ